MPWVTYFVCYALRPCTMPTHRSHLGASRIQLMKTLTLLVALLLSPMCLAQDAAVSGAFDGSTTPYQYSLDFCSGKGGLVWSGYAGEDYKFMCGDDLHHFYWIDL